MNNLPDNVTQADLDNSIYSDEVWEMACIMFNTESPTQEQMDLACKKLEFDAQPEEDMEVYEDLH
jgi:hypothetical protein